MSRSVFLARILTAFLMLGAGIVTRIQTAGLPFGTLKRIGSGFFPTLFGNLMIILSLCMLVSLFVAYRRGQVNPVETEDIITSLKGFGVFLAILIGFILVNHFAGFIIASLLAVFAAGYALGLKGWRLWVLTAATTLVIWLVFDLWLMLSLPSGVWFS